MEFLQIRIHSCASLAVSCMTPLTTSLENFRSQLTLCLLLIGTFNHGRVISHPHPLGHNPGGIAHSRPLQVGHHSPEMSSPGNLEVQTLEQNQSLQDCIPRESRTVTPPIIYEGPKGPLFFFFNTTAAEVALWSPPLHMLRCGSQP